MTEDLQKRMKEHTMGLLGKYTKGKGPCYLVYNAEMKDKSVAIIRERYLKPGSGIDFLKWLLTKVCMAGSHLAAADEPYDSNNDNGSPLMAVLFFWFEIWMRHPADHGSDPFLNLQFN